MGGCAAVEIQYARGPPVTGFNCQWKPSLRSSTIFYIQNFTRKHMLTRLPF